MQYPKNNLTPSGRQGIFFVLSGQKLAQSTSSPVLPFFIYYYQEAKKNFLRFLYKGYIHKSLYCKNLHTLSALQRIALAFVFLISAFQNPAFAKSSDKQLSLPAHELHIIDEVAQEYKLTPWQRALLIAIRKAENGRKGREFGVLHPKAINTTYKNQAQWAAGSIKKRCPDKSALPAFANRWAPPKVSNDPHGLNKNWLPNVEGFLKQGGF